MSSINQQSSTNSSNLLNYLQETSSATNPSLPPPILPIQIANNSSRMNTSVDQNSYPSSPFPNFQYPTNQPITSVNNAFSQIFNPSTANPSTANRALSNSVSYSHLPQSSAFYSPVNFTPLDPYATTSSQPTIDPTNVQRLNSNFSQPSSSQPLAPHYQPNYHLPTAAASQYATNTQPEQSQGYPNRFDHSSSYSNPNQTGVQPSSSNSSHSHSYATTSNSQRRIITAQELNSSFSHSHTPQSLAPYYQPNYHPPTAAASQYATNTQPQQNQDYFDLLDHSSFYSNPNQTGVQPSSSNFSHSHIPQLSALNLLANSAPSNSYATTSSSQPGINQTIAQELNRSFSHSHTPQSDYHPPTAAASQYATNTQPQGQGYPNFFDYRSSYSNLNQTGAQPSGSNSSHSHIPHLSALNSSTNSAPSHSDTITSSQPRINQITAQELNSSFSHSHIPQSDYHLPTAAASQYVTNTQPQGQGYPNRFDHSSSYSNPNQTDVQPSSSSFSHPQIAPSNHQTSFTPELHTQSLPQLNNTMNMNRFLEAPIPSAQSLNNPSFPGLPSELFTPGFMSSRPSDTIKLQNRLQNALTQTPSSHPTQTLNTSPQNPLNAASSNFNFLRPISPLPTIPQTTPNPTSTQSAPNSYVQSSESYSSPNSPLTIDQELSPPPPQQLQNSDNSLNVDKNKSASTSYGPIRNNSSISRLNLNPSGTPLNTFHVKTDEKNNTLNTTTQNTVVSSTVAQETTNIKKPKHRNHINALEERINTYDSQSILGIRMYQLKNYIKSIDDPIFKKERNSYNNTINSLITLHIFATDVCDIIKNDPKKEYVITDINRDFNQEKGSILHTSKFIKEFLKKNPPLKDSLDPLIPNSKRSWMARFTARLGKANYFIKQHGNACGLKMKTLEEYWK